MEGAGRDKSIGVNIRLPFEQGANAFIAQDPKLVEMRFFFTRKLMLIKESDGYVVLPGGFGTLDEGFELLTLLQTGKAEPAPVVMLDVPGGDYWQGWDEFLRTEVEPRGLVSDDDRSLFTITDDVGQATAEILGFYRNYQSCRWVGDLLVMRLKVAPDRAALADLNRRFADIVTGGAMRMSKPLPPNAPTPTISTSRVWCSGSTRSTTDGSASSSTPSTSFRAPRPEPTDQPIRTGGYPGRMRPRSLLRSTSPWTGAAITGPSGPTRSGIVTPPPTSRRPMLFVFGRGHLRNDGRSVVGRRRRREPDPLGWNPSPGQ